MNGCLACAAGVLATRLLAVAFFAAGFLAAEALPAVVRGVEVFAAAVFAAVALVALALLAVDRFPDAFAAEVAPVRVLDEAWRLAEALGLARAGRGFARAAFVARAALGSSWERLLPAFTRVRPLLAFARTVAFGFARLRGRARAGVAFTGRFGSSSRTRFDRPSVLMDRALRRYPIPIKPPQYSN